MLKELAEFIAEKTMEAQQPSVTNVDVSKDRIEKIGDEVKFVEGQPARRNHELYSIEDLVKFANDYSDVSLWYSRNGVVALLDSDDRRDRLFLKLSLSPQMTNLYQLENSKPEMSQAKAISMLRISFKGCVSDGLADALRRVKFNVNQAGETEIQRTKTSVGKSVLAEFHGIEGLPETVEISVPVFASRFVTVQPVLVAIEPDPTTQTFRFIPFPGELERAMTRAEEALGQALSAASTSGVVYFGAP